VALPMVRIVTHLDEQLLYFSTRSFLMLGCMGDSIVG